ncbi:hypothetical protein ACLB1T_05505 [Escherichia coli]
MNHACASMPLLRSPGGHEYNYDYVMAGMCYAKYVRSPIAHGYAVSINDEQARSLPGVLTLPNTCWIFHLLLLGMPDDQNKRIPPISCALLTRHVRHHGDAVAIVVARDELTAEKRHNWSALSGKNYPLSPRQKRRWQKTLHQSITVAIY